MANSLQEQLLKAGLVDKQQVNKAKKAKQLKQKQQRHVKQDSQDDAKRLAREAKEREAERNRELNRQKQAAIQAKAISAEIDQLIQTNRLPHEEGEIAYNFVDKGKICRIHVSEKTQSLLSRGQLAIVKLNETYGLVPAETAQRIVQRDATRVILLNERLQDIEDADDPYAEFKVPDDLTW